MSSSPLAPGPARAERRRPHACPPPAVTCPVPAVIVTVPARNEAALIGDCVRSLDEAAVDLDRPVTVVVAADSCSDDTAERIRRSSFRNIELVVTEGRWRCAGGARRAAVQAGRIHHGGPDVWLASTDADCVVAGDWLFRMVAHAAAGHLAVAGVVDLDPSSDQDVLEAFRRGYRNADEHALARTPHVHAANFAVRAAVYDRVGGWNPRVELGEEHDLHRRLHASGVAVHADDELVVTTSARTDSRVIGGFASALAGWTLDPRSQPPVEVRLLG